MFPNRAPSGVSVLGVLLLLLLWCPSAHAQKLKVTPRITVSQNYSSNPTLEEELEADDPNPESDFFLEARPSLALALEGEHGMAALDVGLRMRRYYKLHDLDATNPFGKLRINQKLTPRMTLFGSAGYEEITNRDEVVYSDVRLLSGSPDLKVSEFDLGLTYLLTPLLSSTVNYSYYDADYDLAAVDETQLVDQTTQEATLSFTFLLTPLDQISVMARQRHSDFGGRDLRIGVLDQDGNFLGAREFTRRGLKDRQTSVLLGWTRLWTPIWSTEILGGTRLLKSEGNDVVGSLGSGDLSTDSSGTAFIGSFILNRNTDITETALSLTSQTRPSSGDGGSLDVKSIGLTHTRRLNSRVSLSLWGNMSTQKSAGEFDQAISSVLLGPAVDCASGVVIGDSNPVCIETARAGFDQDKTYRRFGSRLTWRTRKRWTSFLSYAYVEFEEKQGRTRSYDDHRVSVGFTYAFDLDEEF